MAEPSPKIKAPSVIAPAASLERRRGSDTGARVTAVLALQQTYGNAWFTNRVDQQSTQHAEVTVPLATAEGQEVLPEVEMSAMDRTGPLQMTMTTLVHTENALLQWLTEHPESSPERHDIEAKLALVQAVLYQRSHLAPLQTLSPSLVISASIARGFRAGLDRAVDYTIAFEETKRELSTVHGGLQFYNGVQVGSIYGALESFKDNVVGLAALIGASLLAALAVQLGPMLMPMLPVLSLTRPDLYAKLKSSAEVIAGEFKDLVTKALMDPSFLSNSAFDIGVGMGLQAGDSFSKCKGPFEKGQYAGEALGYAVMELVLLVAGPEELLLKAGRPVGKALAAAGGRLSARARSLSLAKLAPDLVEALGARAGRIRQVLEESVENLQRAMRGERLAAEGPSGLSPSDVFGRAGSDSERIPENVLQSMYNDAMADVNKVGGASPGTKLVPKKAPTQQVGIAERVRMAKLSKDETKVLEGEVAERYQNRLVRFDERIEIEVEGGRPRTLTQVDVELDTVIIEVTSQAGQRKVAQGQRLFSKSVNPAGKRVVVYDPGPVPPGLKLDLEAAGVRVAETLEELDELVR